jgi:hypothetical protein
VTRVFLRSDVHAAALGDDIIVLDIAADAYVSLPGAASLFQFDAETGAVDAVAPDVADDLVNSGLAQCTRPSAPRLPPPPALPRRGVDLEAPFAPPTLRDLLRLVGCLLDLARFYRGQPFSRILTFAQQARARVPYDAPPSELHAVVRRFHAAAIWLPAPGKCLVRSFVLLRFLHRCGHDAAWVIGARTWPCAAHCWLQVGDVALDDAPERLVSYQPICAV